MSHSTIDRFVVWGLTILGILAGLLVLLIVGFLFREAYPALDQIGIGSFFTDASWNPTENRYSLLPMLCGTLMAMGGAILTAAPLGICSAVFCQFYAPPIAARTYRSLIEVLAGIPSVVYGLWGLVVLVPLIAEFQPPGPSLLAGIMILAIMILPTIMLMADAAISGVPQEYIRGAVALGLGKRSIIRRVILPAAKSGLVTGIILGAGRAIGETMAILMVCGNIAQIPQSLFEPVRTLTANIALEMAYAMADHRAALFISGLFLLVLVMVLVSIAEIISRGRLYG